MQIPKKLPRIPLYSQNRFTGMFQVELKAEHYNT